MSVRDWPYNTGPDVELTAEEAAMIADVSADAIRRAVRDGRLKARRIGPMYLIKRSDLDGYEPVRKPPRRPSYLERTDPE